MEQYQKPDTVEIWSEPQKDVRENMTEEYLSCGSCSCVVIHYQGGMNEIQIKTWENIPAECQWIGSDRE